MIKWIQDLYQLCMEYSGDALYADVLQPNLDAVRNLMQPLHRFRRLVDAPPIPPEQVIESGLFDLFALNVLNDYLLYPLTVSQREYRQFFTALGFEVFAPGDVFQPHLCEIVAVENWGQPEAGVRLGASYWPGLRFGELIFSRCGVSVICHSSLLTSGIADHSTLYFTHARMHRNCQDLSHGWGSNSRWATRFHRNYETDGFVLLNVDGEDDLSSNYTPVHAPPFFQDIDLPVAAARELLLHRCFVQFNDPHEDPFPYKWQLALHNEAPLWPLHTEKIVPFDEALKAVLQH